MTFTTALYNHLTAALLACDCSPAESQRLQDEELDRRDNPPQAQLKLKESNGR